MKEYTILVVSVCTMITLLLGSLMFFIWTYEMKQVNNPYNICIKGCTKLPMEESELRSNCLDQCNEDAKWVINKTLESIIPIIENKFCENNETKQ